MRWLLLFMLLPYACFGIAGSGLVHWHTGPGIADATPYPPATNNLIGDWAFDDLAGYTRNYGTSGDNKGKLEDTTKVEWATNAPAGWPAGSMYFNQVDHNTAVLTENTLSITGAPAISGMQWIWAYEGYPTWAYEMNTGGGQRFQLQVVPPDKFRLAIGGSYSQWATTASTGQWVHVAWSLAAGDAVSNANFWVDGDLKPLNAATSGANTLNLLNSKIYMGNNYSMGTSGPHSWLKDQWFATNVVWTHAQVTNYYRSQVAPPTTGSVVIWPCTNHVYMFSQDDSTAGNDIDINLYTSHEPTWDSDAGWDGSYDFDGTSDFMWFTNDLPTNFPWSVAGWFRAEGSSFNGTMFSLSDEGEANVYYCLSWDATKKIELLLNNGASAYNVDGSSTLQTNTWYHGALVALNSTNWTVYVNGAVELTSYSNHTWAAGVDRGGFGAVVRGTEFDWFSGKLDEWQLYENIALSQSQITNDLFEAAKTNFPGY